MPELKTVEALPATSTHSNGVFTLQVTNVTGTRSMPIEVRTDLPAEDIARSAADLMALPDGVPYALRDDQSSAFLRDRTPIGEQITPNARVTVTPKTHLGA